MNGVIKFNFIVRDDFKNSFQNIYRDNVQKELIEINLLTYIILKLIVMSLLFYYQSICFF